MERRNRSRVLRRARLSRRRGDIRLGGIARPPITLNPHQVEAAHKLITSSQKGLLLWHMMGTGKTLSVLSVALNYPGRRVVVFCPEDLTYVWKAEIARIPELRNTFAFYAYEKSGAFFKQDTLAGDILILDEVQHLITRLRAAVGVGAMMELLKTPHKVLALSGTPIYTDERDLPYAINLCAGREIVPYNEFAFRKKYYAIIKGRSAVFGYIKPYMNAANRVVFSMSMVLKFMHMIYPEGGENLVCDKNGFAKSIVVWMSAKTRSAAKIAAAMNVNSLMAGLVAQVDKAGLVAAMFENISASARSRAAAALGESGDMARASPLIMSLVENGTMMVAAQILPTVVSIMLVAIFGRVRRFEDFRKFDAAAFVRDAAPFISYHKNRPGEDPAFPEETHVYRGVTYNFFQLDKWMTLTQGYLTESLAQDIDLSSDAEYYSERIGFDAYLDKGCIIGNLKSASETGHSPKFAGVLSVAKGKRAVFYSRFVEKGILALAAFLDWAKEPYLYLDKGLSDANKTTILREFYDAHSTGAQSFLLLHPCYSEGVSILGAEQIHLLEPIPQLAKRQQVVARVSRYLSHAHLSPANRKVEVSQWYCRTNQRTQELVMQALRAKKWFESSTEVELSGDDRHVRFPREWGTPDLVVMYMELHRIRTTSEIVEAVRSIAPQQIDCCIRYPSMAQEASCMQSIDKYCEA